MDGRIERIQLNKERKQKKEWTKERERKQKKEWKNDFINMPEEMSKL